MEAQAVAYHQKYVYLKRFLHWSLHCIIILILLLLLASFRRMKIWSIDTQSFNHTAITKLDDLEEEKK